jgi:hypothetical protein
MYVGVYIYNTRRDRAESSQDKRGKTNTYNKETVFLYNMYVYSIVMNVFFFFFVCTILYTFLSFMLLFFFFFVIKDDRP